MLVRIPVIALSLLVPTVTLAAQPTDVPDAADGDNPFDAHLSLGFDYAFQSALITRENTQDSTQDQSNQPRTVDVRELSYQRNTFKLRPRMEFGLFHDLSLFFEWPIVIFDQQNTRFASGTTSASSTLVRDMQAPPPIDGWPQTGGGDYASDNTRFGYPVQDYQAWNINKSDGTYTSMRAGFDYPLLGVRWSPLNDARDASKPTVTLQFDYNLGVIPLPVANPTTDARTQAEPGPVASGLHEMHFHVGMSKRWLLLDPYFLVDYWLPFAASNAYLGYQPRHRGGFTLGLEIIAHENPKLDRKLAFHVATVTRYVSEGRDYSEMSDALNEMTYTSQYMQIGGNLGVYFRLFEYVTLDLTGAAMYDTEHFLTAEAIGRDKNGNDVVDLQVGDNERSAYFNPILDTPGRRLKVEENIRLQVFGRLSLTF